MPSILAEQLEPREKGTKKRKKILIVDDDQAMVDVLGLRLSRQGFETVSAESGQEGLSIARNDQPDLIVLDLRLPDVDGFAVCKQLVDSPETCSIPVIILSGLDSPDIIRECRAAGGGYFLRKPYDPNTLLVLIQRALQGWEA